MRVSQVTDAVSDRQPPSSPAISSERRALVEQARTAWIKQLIDRSRHNNLLFFRPLEKGTLDLSGVDPDMLVALLAEKPLPLGQLLPEEEKPRAVLREIHRRALANLEEKGLETLFLA